jgi:hypothetical protein
MAMIRRAFPLLPPPLVSRVPAWIRQPGLRAAQALELFRVADRAKLWAVIPLFDGTRLERLVL